jgi:hypothetical protein
MAPTVKKAKSAFLFFQGANLAKIRAELGPETTMGQAMTEVRCVLPLTLVALITGALVLYPFSRLSLSLL